MPPYLPGEITDRIIWSVPDVHCGFHSDYKTLLSCALVCQQWHPASRAALLDYVGIHNKAAYDSFIHHVLYSERMTPYLDLTRTLWMHETPAQDDNGLTRREQSWSYRFIHDFAGHFPNLRQLSIWSVDWCSLPPHPSIHGSISRFTALRSLDLHSCRLPSWNTVRRLVTALSPSLNSLTLWDVTCVSARDRAALMHPAARAPSLTTLKLICHWGDEDCLIPFLGWLSHTAARHSLRRLVLSRGGLSQEYMGFLLAVAPVITELDISDISCKVHTSHAPAPDLAGCSFLNHCSFRTELPIPRAGELASARIAVDVHLEVILEQRVSHASQNTFPASSHHASSLP